MANVSESAWGNETQGALVQEKKLRFREVPEAAQPGRGMRTVRGLHIYNHFSNYRGLKTQFYLMTKYG